MDKLKPSAFFLAANCLTHIPVFFIGMFTHEYFGRFLKSLICAHGSKQGHNETKVSRRED
jgi:hypothetical protein